MNGKRVSGYRIIGKPMVRIAILVLAVSQTTFLHAQDLLSPQPWWIGVNLGGGQFRLTSDQGNLDNQGGFSIALQGGRKIGRRIRIGAEVGGNLVEAYSMFDKSAGKSLANYFMLIDVFPAPNIPVFIRAGTGWARFYTSRPQEFGSGGWAWKTGIGYDIKVNDRASITPAFSFSRGYLSDIHNSTVVQTGRCYSIWDVTLGFNYHFGKSRTETPKK